MRWAEMTFKYHEASFLEDWVGFLTLRVPKGGIGSVHRLVVVKPILQSDQCSQ